MHKYNGRQGWNQRFRYVIDPSLPIASYTTDVTSEFVRCSLATVANNYVIGRIGRIVLRYAFKSTG